jgi:hypothetical protein
MKISSGNGAAQNLFPVADFGSERSLRNWETQKQTRGDDCCRSDLRCGNLLTTRVLDRTLRDLSWHTNSPVSRGLRLESLSKTGACNEARFSKFDEP